MHCVDPADCIRSVLGVIKQHEDTAKCDIGVTTAILLGMVVTPVITRRYPGKDLTVFNYTKGSLLFF